MNLIKLAIHKPIFGHMVSLTILCVGIGSAILLKREIFPVVETGFIFVTVPYPNASPEEVEDLVVVPLEDEIDEVDGIAEYTSTSMENIAMLFIEIDQDEKNHDRVFNDVQRKIDRVNLPEGSEDPIVELFVLEDPVIDVCITGGANETARRAYAEYLEDKITSISGVGSVTKQGWRDAEFWVDVKLDALQQNEISLLEITEVLSRRNVNLPGGKVLLDQKEQVLRTIGKFYRAEEISEVVVRSNADGKAIKIKDLATVSRAYEPDASFSRWEGERAIILSTRKKASGDVIRIADEIKTLVQEEQERLPEGIQLGYFNDNSFYVKRRLEIVASNGLVGIVLVSLCLMFFLNRRVAFFTALGIPFSFLGAFILMLLLGASVNMMTMFGMIIVLGMVVDDAIIVGENVFRYIEEGLPAKEASYQGVIEVVKPVTSTILTTCAAFIPLYFAPDMFGKFFSWLVLIVLAVLGASMFECLVLLPSHIAEFSKRTKKFRKKKRLGYRLMDTWVSWYRSSLKLALRLRWWVILFSLLSFAGASYLAANKARVEIFPGDVIDIFIAQYEIDIGSPLEQTESIVAEVENLIKEIPEAELDTYYSLVGQQISLDGSTSTFGTHLGMSLIYLVPQNKRERLTVDIMEELRTKSDQIPELNKFSCDLINFGPPVGKPVEIRVVGDEYPTLRAISQEIQDYLSTLPGVVDIEDSFTPGKKETHILVDEPQAARFGLSAQQISSTVLAAFAGIEATQVRDGKEEVAVRVRLDEPWRNQLETLHGLQVQNRQGRMIDLTNVTYLTQAQGLSDISHVDGVRTIEVLAGIDNTITSSKEVNEAVLRQFKDLSQRYPGYRIELGGEGKETQKLLRFTFLAMIAAVMLIYLILALQFDSFFQPFILLSSIPCGLVGVVLALILHDKPISIMAMMGMVGLTGVVVNDAIVLVSFINNRRRKGTPLFQAIMESGTLRFRPILLTSITTVAGLFPVIYGIGGYEPFIAPAAITLAYGLIFATLLTLMLVPCVYLASQDVKNVILKLVKRKA